MADPRHLRISRELFLAAFGANLGAFEAWVTDRLTSLLEEDEVPMGSPIFAIGEPPESFYFMREGSIQMVREGSPPWILAGRHVFGMSDALLERPRTRSAVALTDLQLMKIRVEDWLELLDDSFELARASVAGLAKSVADDEVKLLTTARAYAPAVAPATELRASRLTVIERLALLVDVPLLRGAGVQPLSDLAVATSEVSFASGETVFERAIPRDKMFVVVEGEVQASRSDPELVWRFGAGRVVCEAAAFGEPALAWSAKALVPTRALAFRVDDWFDLMEENFDMVRSALGALELRRDEILKELASGDPAPASS